MGLPTGTQLGPYEILSAIGAGGMGEVYQAHDTKLGRDVAIKVLPEAFAHDSERLSRFQREAKMLAALNHPNIATIYGLEQSNGTTYLVMELVSGETLAERVKRDGAVPIEEALAICKQIAEALEAAYEKGIIHRDLKPANVKVTPEGKVKVLDFGLAKAFAGEGADSNPSQSPTLSAVATMQGVLLGTAAYMSPEQARGKAVDKRTDIWAFGCVLYELLTGKQAFQGETTTEILAAVLRGEPDWQALPPSTAAKIRDLLRRCLQKDLNKRCRDAGDVRIEIEEALTAPLLTGPPITNIPPKTIWRWALGIGVACLIVAVIAGLAVWNLRSSSVAPVSRSMFSLPPGEQLEGLQLWALALSPDGNHMVYVASRSGVRQLYLRSMDSFEARPIPATEGANGPFFSPDSQWVGFFADNKLKKVSINGGPPLTLCDTVGPYGFAWGSNDMIVFETGGFGNGYLATVPAAGGTPQRLTTLDLKRSELVQGWPDFLPGAKAVLFTASANPISWVDAQLSLFVLKTGERRALNQIGMRPRYAPSGHLVYAQGGSLMAAPFNLGRLELTGAAIPVVDGVSQYGEFGGVQYSFSDNGTLAYIPGASAPQSTLVWVDRTGVEQTLAAPVQAYTRPRVSPDGRRVAVETAESEGQIWIYDLGRETLTRLTFEGTENGLVAWTPDGKRVAFTSGAPGNLFWEPADGSGKAERLTTSESRQLASSWSPDGQALAFVGANPMGGQQIWMLRPGDPKPQLFLQPSLPGRETAPKFSPDGRWLAYASNESGQFQIYVRPYPGPGEKWQVSTDGGTEPVWNPKGRELFYRNGDKMMAVEVTTQRTFSAGKPRLLFEGHYMTAASIPDYDVSPDGQRFLMVKAGQRQPASQINIVQNWFEELKQKVPTGKK